MGGCPRAARIFGETANAARSIAAYSTMRPPTSWIVVFPIAAAAQIAVSYAITTSLRTASLTKCIVRTARA